MQPYEIKNLTQKIQMNKSGSQVQGFPLKVKVGFYTKPYIGTYPTETNTISGQSNLYHQLKFRCRKSFRMYMPENITKQFYILFADSVNTVNNIEIPYFKPENLYNSRRILYAGDKQRVALKDEVIYGLGGVALTGYIKPGIALKEGEMICKQNGSYLTPADIEVYCPGDITEIFNFPKSDMYKVTEKWITLKCI